MPEHTIPTEQDLHGHGTFQVGNAPMTLKQKAQQAATNRKTTSMGRSNQKINSFAPGSDLSVRAKINAAGSGPVSFSDQD